MKKLLLAILFSGSYCVLYASNLISDQNNNQSADAIQVKPISEAELTLNKEVERLSEYVPSFGLYKDNYFITGIPIGWINHTKMTPFCQRKKTPIVE